MREWPRGIEPRPFDLPFSALKKYRIALITSNNWLWQTNGDHKRFGWLFPQTLLDSLGGYSTSEQIQHFGVKTAQCSTTIMICSFKNTLQRFLFFQISCDQQNATLTHNVMLLDTHHLTNKKSCFRASSRVWFTLRVRLAPAHARPKTQNFSLVLRSKPIFSKMVFSCKESW